MHLYKNNRITILLYGIICLIILYISEQILLFPYVIKTFIKLPLFVGLPFLINRYWLKEKMRFKIKRKDGIYLLVWSILVIGTIMLAYTFLKPYIDVNAIKEDFAERMQISRKYIYIAAIYTVVVNSFIEEYFFRGFIFKGLCKYGDVGIGYIISSLLFGIYHIAIFGTWFKLPLMLLMLFGLFVGGLIFAYFAKRTDSILGPWIIHLSADLIIIIIGLNILL